MKLCNCLSATAGGFNDGDRQELSRKVVGICKRAAGLVTKKEHKSLYFKRQDYRALTMDIEEGAFSR